MEDQDSRQGESITEDQDLQLEESITADQDLQLGESITEEGGDGEKSELSYPNYCDFSCKIQLMLLQLSNHSMIKSFDFENSCVDL